MTAAALNVPDRAIFNHDNLEVLRGINSNCVDLIYLDPPFNTKKQWHAPTGSSAAGASFKDIFYSEDIKDEWLDAIRLENTPLHSFLLHTKTNGIAYNYAYLAYMSIRLIECHRVLKSSGGIYLHCDPTMAHYLKVVMDCIFGDDNYIDEITWKRAHAHKAPRRFGSIKDTILFYGKTPDYFFEPVVVGYSKSYVENNFRYEDEGGKYQLVALTGPGVNKKDKKYKKYHPSTSRRHWAIPSRVVEKFVSEEEAAEMSVIEKLKLIDAEGYVVFSENGIPRFKSYLNDLEGAVVQNLWTDINNVGSRSRERTGYPTQKPLALLERIIQASSNENDVVLDPFCGCATTCVAAERMNRRWIGIDISIKAYDLIRQRLEKEVPTQKKTLWDKEVNFSTYPPTRTDQGLPENRDEGYVYIISHPILTPHYVEGKMTYKVGIAKNFERRLASYQTSAPGRAYAEEYKVLTPKYKEIERALFDRFDGDRENEWVTADKDALIAAIKELL